MKDTYISRRQRLFQDKGENTVIVVFSGAAPMRSQDAAYDFFVDRNFFYLTGIERENMILVMRKNYLGEYSESLFIEPYDEVLAKWLKNFVRRFFSQQFKRSCVPDGVKVGSVSLSPRGDWKMPSDAVSKLYLEELENL